MMLLKYHTVARCIMRAQDLSGQVFGKLTVLKRIGTTTKRSALWKCKCECGRTTAVITRDLNSGNTRSCGCLHQPHGHARKNKLTPEFRSWQQMLERCNRPKHKSYAYYGGRGITVCPEWLDFAQFIKDVGYKPTPQHTLDRINNDGNYEPGNVRWATRWEQAHNCRPRKRKKML